ncbi:tetratricopeptide repeat protein 33-like isoform X2 [Macrobrachium nipponense]|uniref:tetratricopeptide repeat protein 33-like isoform X2 n=1 Tax=Macrobrachium nipponense TaxID=159736 RepID=UPI0030C89B7F
MSTSMEGLLWMQSFGWKRKAGLAKPRPAVFSGEEAEDDSAKDPDVDWLTAAKRPKVMELEDVKVKARRLSNEGVMLAEAGRWWAAIGRWNGALELTPDDHTLHEMMAQAYMQVGEVFPALTSAQKAVELYPTWWIGLQTLGRAQLGLGEVELAVKTFSKAVHIAPDQQELWREDLLWSSGLLQKQREIKAEKAKLQAAIEQGTVSITELQEPHIEGTIREKSLQLYRKQQLEEAARAQSSSSGKDEGTSTEDKNKSIDITKMVRMRVT